MALPCCVAAIRLFSSVLASPAFAWAAWGFFCIRRLAAAVRTIRVSSMSAVSVVSTRLLSWRLPLIFRVPAFVAGMGQISICDEEPV